MSDNTSKIDAAIAEAKARREKKGSKPKDENNTSATARKRLTQEERDAREAQRKQEREQRAAARAAKREAKQAAREASRKPAHMAKVAKAAERLGGLSDSASAELEKLTSNFSVGDLDTISQHIAVFVRAKRTEAALSRELKVGQAVKIVSGDPRFVGRTGTVTKAQRIRCYVDVPGTNKPVYLFTSDVEPLSASKSAVTSSDPEAKSA